MFIQIFDGKPKFNIINTAINSKLELTFLKMWHKFVYNILHSPVKAEMNQNYNYKCNNILYQLISKLCIILFNKSCKNKDYIITTQVFQYVK